MNKILMRLRKETRDGLLNFNRASRRSRREYAQVSITTRKPIFSLLFPLHWISIKSVIRQEKKKGVVPASTYVRRPLIMLGGTFD